MSTTLPHLRTIGRQINAKLLEIERVADGVTPGPSLFDRLQLPTLSPTGQRVSALRFGDRRVHALFAALCRFSHLPGFRHRDLRPLRLHGIVKRAPGTQRYTLTSKGARAAFSSTPRSPPSATPTRLTPGSSSYVPIPSRSRAPPTRRGPPRALESNSTGRLNLTPPEAPTPLELLSCPAAARLCCRSSLGCSWSLTRTTWWICCHSCQLRHPSPPGHLAAGPRRSGY
jgi:hypothetical protein